MGLFGNSRQQSAKTINWIELEKETDVADLRSRSFERAQVIFKHSTRCGISRSVLNRLEKEWDDNPDVDMHFLDLLQFRAISNLVAETFNVWHESPQLIVIKDGKAVAHGSHHNADIKLIQGTK